MLLYRFIDKKLIARPHSFVPLVVFVCTLLFFLCNPHSVLYTFSLNDPDDYMRLNETINWLQWQGWYDLSHPRLSPGMHTVIHWSRLLDLPLAAMMLPFLKTWGYRSSAMLAALVEPVLLLIFLIALVPAMVRPLLGRGSAKLAVLFVPFAASLLFNFSPGRVDHHNWNILIAGVGFAGVQYMILCRGGWSWAAATAVCYGLSFWISPEVGPCIVLTLICLAFYAALKGGFVLRNAAVFGLVFALSTAAFLPLALPLPQWTDRSISWFSAAYVIFAGLTGAIFILSWALLRHTKTKLIRFVVIGSLALCGGLLFYLLVPDVAHGPFADYDVFDATTALDNIGEAAPLLRSLEPLPHNPLSELAVAANYMHFLFPETLALLLCLWGFWTASKRRHVLWTIQIICLGGTVLFALFFQYRVLWFAQLFELGPLTCLVFLLWGRFKTWTSWQRLRATIIMFFAVTQGPLFANALTRGDVINACNLKPAAEWIAGPWGYMDRPYTILAGSNEGPELLFRTPHNVLAGNYDVAGNSDVYKFFSARDDKEAEDILRHWKVDLVLTCRSTPPLYRGVDHMEVGKNAFLEKGSDGKLHLVSSLKTPTLVEKILKGEQPSWLRPVVIPPSKDYLLFEVHLPPVSEKTP